MKEIQQLCIKCQATSPCGWKGLLTRLEVSGSSCTLQCWSLRYPFFPPSSDRSILVGVHVEVVDDQLGLFSHNSPRDFL